MSTPLRILIGGLVCLLTLTPQATAQMKVPTDQSGTDMTWLAQIKQPEVVVDWLAARYDKPSTSVVFDNLIIDWNDSTDSDVKGHSIIKAFNCVPHGSLVDEKGDSLGVIYGQSKIQVVSKEGSRWIYRVVSPVQVGPGMFPEGNVEGDLTLVISAAKVVDRKYTVEGSGSTSVEVRTVELEE